MSVEGVLSSPSKVQVLRVLSDSSSAYSPQELEQETTKNISVIYDAVRELEEEGVIISVKADGRKNYYRLNKDNPFSEQIRELFKAEKEQYDLEELPAHLVNVILDAENKLRNKVGGLEMTLLFGSMARGDFTPESDIDFYLVVDEKTTEKEDQIYDVLDNYEKDFSVIVRDKEGFRGDFVKELSDLGKSILVEGYAILFDNIRNKFDDDKNNFLYDSSVLADWESKEIGIEELAESISKHIEVSQEIEDLKFDIETMRESRR